MCWCERRTESAFELPRLQSELPLPLLPLLPLLLLLLLLYCEPLLQRQSQSQALAAAMTGEVTQTQTLRLTRRDSQWKCCPQSRRGSLRNCHRR